MIGYGNGEKLYLFIFLYLLFYGKNGRKKKEQGHDEFFLLIDVSLPQFTKVPP